MGKLRGDRILTLQGQLLEDGIRASIRTICSVHGFNRSNIYYAPNIVSPSRPGPSYLGAAHGRGVGLRAVFLVIGARGNVGENVVHSLAVRGPQLGDLDAPDSGAPDGGSRRPSTLPTASGSGTGLGVDPHHWQMRTRDCRPSAGGSQILDPRTSEA